MKKFALTFMLLTISSTAFAAVDGFYSSVNELELILKNSSQIREKLGTAYRISSIVSRADDRGYLVSAATNRNELCTINIEVVKKADPANFMASPRLSLVLGEVSCGPLDSTSDDDSAVEKE